MKNGAVHVLEETHDTAATVATGEFALAAGALADGKFLQNNGIAHFKHFRVGHAGIGHVDVNAGCPGKAAAIVHVPGWCATADRFIVLVTGIAVSEVVHGARRIGEGSKCHQQAIGDMLAGFGVSGNDGGRIDRLQHAAFGNDDVDRFEASGIHRNVCLDHQAENIEHGGAGHRFGCIEVVFGNG